MKHLFTSQKQFVHDWMTSSVIGGLGVADPFHGLHGHPIYLLWTFFHGDISEQIFTKPELKIGMI